MPSKRGNLNPESFMKTRTKNLFLPPALIAGLGLMLVGRAAAQTFTTLHSFIPDSDGSVPNAVILSGNTLYGTTFSGGGCGKGTVFSVNTDSSAFTTLYEFTDT